MAPVMFTDSTGYFILGVMIASIIVSIAFEVYEDFHEDGDFDFGWRYLGAAVSGFFNGLSGGVASLMLYSFIGSSLDYFISGNYNADTFGSDMLKTAGFAVAGVLIGKALKFGASKLKANSLFNLDNNVANKALSNMGLGVKIGSRAAKSGLSKIIYESNKYFLGEVIENVGSNSVNNGLLLVFD